MGQSKPIEMRRRSFAPPMTAEECRQRAADLFAVAYEMKPGTARQSTLKDACDYRMLAEMKTGLPVKGSSPAK
jgi:hypothetical protein